MKCIFVVGSLAGGGAERVVANLATNMAESGHDVSVILLVSANIGYPISNKIKIIDGTKRYKIPGLGYLSRIRLIRKTAKNNNPDAIISFTVKVNIYSLLACLGLKNELIICERNDPRFDPEKKTERVIRDLLYPFADKYVFQTEGEKQFFNKKIQNKSKVIYNPVSPDIPEIYRGERRKAFVSVVRLEPQKNVRMAIEAFEIVSSKHPEFVYEIYGAGSQRAYLEKLVADKKLSDKIVFKGVSTNVYEEIKDAYGFILSSNYEGMSNSLIEAMAIGLPSISTDHPSKGASEIICDGINGFLVAVNDAKTLAEKINLLIEDKQLYTNISSNAVKIKEELSVDKITSQWIEFID